MEVVTSIPERPRRTQEQELESIDFGVRKSLRYHSKLRRRNEVFDTVTKVLVVLTNATAFLTLIGGEKGAIVSVLVAVAASIALFDIVYGFARRASAHEDLYRRFSELAVKIARTLNPTPEDVAALRAERLQIEADEPPANDLLERWCWNLEAESRKVDHKPHALSDCQRFRLWASFLR